MRRPQQGYALIVVLGGLVLLALVAAALDARIERWRDSQRGWGEWVAAGVDLESSRDEVLALIMTLPMGPQGFGPLRVDGRHYVLPSGVRFTVQDQRGLLSVADVQQPLILRNWLQRQGLQPAEVDSLIDKLADYADGDRLRRLNGAEAADYKAAGLAPPRNDWLMSPYELRRVMGWHARQALWERASDWASATREGWLNPNTAPAALLHALPGATPEKVEALLRARELQHIDSAATLAALTGLQMAEDVPAYYPGHLYRLRLWQAGGARTLEYTVMLTPEAPAQPWAVLDVRHLPPEPEDVKPPLPAPKLPGRADPPN
jgi:general secretion pathway protein K